MPQGSFRGTAQPGTYPEWVNTDSLRQMYDRWKVASVGSPNMISMSPAQIMQWGGTTQNAPGTPIGTGVQGGVAQGSPILTGSQGGLMRGIPIGNTQTQQGSSLFAGMQGGLMQGSLLGNTQVPAGQQQLMSGQVSQDVASPGITPQQLALLKLKQGRKLPVSQSIKPAGAKNYAFK